MYYPKQIPYSLNLSLRELVDYTEVNFYEFSDFCMCIWQMKTKKLITKKVSHLILPDACIDLIIDFHAREIYFCGFSNETEYLQLHGTVDSMGVRLKPGAFYSLFHIASYKMMDQRIPFSEIENEKDLSFLFELETREEQINQLKQYLLSKVSGSCSLNFIKLIDSFYESPMDQQISNLTESFHYTKRHVLRIFKEHYGVSPKVLLNILRLHLCLTLLLDSKNTLLDIAHLCGFYDQAHFIREIKRYTGVSPMELLEKHFM